MKIACIGGGPAGLYLGILIKRTAPEHEVTIYERNRPADTFGFGVVFSDATLGNLAAADPETHAEITSRFARWDDIEVHVGGEVLRSTGHGFCGIERKGLLQILQTRARALGVRLEFEHEVKALAELADADIIVACDGVASWVREALAAEVRPHVDVRPNKFVWLGCTVPYEAFTFLFKQTPHGMFRVHAYRYHERGSTFIVECREDTWRAAGLATADEDRTVAVLEDIFAAELAGHRLVKNRSIWRNFPTVRCEKWHAGNVVLIGDAVHTAHFSIGSGTKLAMEDAIALRDELLATRDAAGALAAYEARRRPETLALQAAAQASLEWFEGTERYAHMAPVQFTYSLMTRSLRVSHLSVEKRDPHLARGVEQLLAAAAGIAGDPPAPTALPFTLGDRTARGRLGFPAGRDRAGASAQGSATEAPGTEASAQAAGLSPQRAAGPRPGIVVARIAAADARAGIARLDAADARAVGEADRDGDIRGVVEAAHRGGALVAGVVATSRVAAAAPPSSSGVAAPANDAAALDAAIARAAEAGVDVLVLDPRDDADAIEALPGVVARVRGRWRTGGWLAAAIRDRPGMRAAVVGHAAQLVRAGANLLWVSSPDEAALHGARVPAAPLADRLRNELGVATALVVHEASLADLDAAIAAGRADLAIVDQLATPRR